MKMTKASMPETAYRASRRCRALGNPKETTMKPIQKIIANQPSWIILSKDVELAVTQLGGHMAPVKFYRASRAPVQPYYISPWQNEDRKLPVPVLRPLRGDFFCLPFGANAEKWKGEQHEVHGEPAWAKWKLSGVCNRAGVTSIRLTLDTKVRRGRVTKELSLVDGHNVVYCRHVVEGMDGRMPLGHHATLAVPETPGCMRVSTSPIVFGMTAPTLFSDPATREYQSLAVNEKFSSLRKAPLLWKKPAYGDCTWFPVREGFTDLLSVFSRHGSGPAWTAAVNRKAGYCWFSLKDPAVQPATILWISNHGRHEPPWDGRNRCLGLEDVCGYFAEGLAASVRANPIANAGIPTAALLSRKRPTAVNYIQGVVKVPRGFDEVATVCFEAGSATFASTNGKNVTVPVNHEFLKSGTL